jgi:hypothetical protein
MTPIKQRHRHNPPHSYGDCHRAALASLLDLPLDDVPHFMHGLGPKDGEIFNARQDDFLRSRALEAIVFPISTDSLADVLRAAGAWNPGKMFLLGGESASGCGHTVIAGPDGILHDPHPDDVGIVAPMDDGAYWITYIVGATHALQVAQP